MSIVASANGMHGFTDGDNDDVGRFIESHCPRLIDSLRFTPTHGSSNLRVTPYNNGSIAQCGRYLVYIKRQSTIVMVAETGDTHYSQINEQEREEGLRILNQHIVSMKAIFGARNNVQPIVPREEVVLRPVVAGPTPSAALTSEYLQEQIRLAIEADRLTRAREEEARKAKEAADALVKAKEAEIEQLKKAMEKFTLDRAAEEERLRKEADEKAFKQLVASKVAEVVPFRQASPVNMENVGGYILAAIFAILAIYIALKGNAAPQYEIPRRSDNDDTFKMMFAAIMQERFRPPAEVMPSSVRQIEPPAATKELVMPEPYIGSWTSIGWIVCFVCALPLISPLLTACCCSSFNWVVVRYFGNEAVADYNERRAKIKNAAKRYNDDDYYCDN